MKRIFLLITAFAFSLVATYAQGQMDAYKLSRNDLSGTARSVAMGGAFGALGGDISAIRINPAGIGVYKSSEIVTTLSFLNNRTHSEINAGRLTENRFKFNFDNLAFVTTFPLQSDVAPTLNIGFSYNRLKNFDRRISVQGYDQQSTLTEYMADITNRNGYFGSDLVLGGSNSNNLWRNEDWLSVLAYNSFLITDTPDQFYPSMNFRNNPNDGLRLDNKFFLQESGSINTYDFNLGTTFADMLSWGMTLSVTDINYRMYSEYSEDFFNDPAVYLGGYDLINSLRTDGNGWQISTGLIFKPIHELRVGVSYHSPTWYNMTDTYWADLDHGLGNLASDPSIFLSQHDLLPYQPGIVKSFDGRDAVSDYRFHTPDQWTFSLATIVAQRAILSADYELTNYGRMRLNDVNGRGLEANGFIKDDFRNASTLRLGAEIRVTPQFSARVGYAWMQSPLKDRFRNNEFEVMTVGSIPHYTLDGNINSFTYGLGYVFNRSFYTDIAFQMSTQKDALYTFWGSEKADLRTNRFQGLLTLGYRFF